MQVRAFLFIDSNYCGPIKTKALETWKYDSEDNKMKQTSVHVVVVVIASVSSLSHQSALVET